MNKIVKGFLLLVLLLACMPLGMPQEAQAADTADGNNVIITSPNGAESYKVGDTIKFKWDSTVSHYATTITYINIYKLRGTTWDPAAANPNVYVDVNNPISTIPNPNNGIVDTGSWSWEIPTSLKSKSGKYVAGVFISYWNDPGKDGGIQTDWSNSPFTIGSDNTTVNLTPAITKLSPESALNGSTITVTGTGFLSNNSVNLRRTVNGVTSVTMPDQQTNASSTTLLFVVPSSLAAGQYEVTVINSSGESQSKPLIIMEPAVSSHAVGTNILGTDGTVYRIDEGNRRSPYTSEGAFLSYKFNSWSNVVSANVQDMNLPRSTYSPCGLTNPITYYIPPRSGSLINDQGTVYLITNGARAGFASQQAFSELGYSFSNVYPGDTSFMCLTEEPINTSARKHPYGTLIKDNGTLYVMKDGYRVAFPSMEVLESWGYWASEAVPANDFDRAAEVSGVMQLRMSNQMSI